jgi:hypothetical protein
MFALLLLLISAVAMACSISILSVQAFLRDHPYATPEAIGVIGFFGPVGAATFAFAANVIYYSILEEFRLHR